MHDLDGIVGILFTLELDEAVALMLVGDLIAWDVDIDHWSALSEELPKNTLVYFLVDVTRVDCGLLVALI